MVSVSVCVGGRKRETVQGKRVQTWQLNVISSCSVMLYLRGGR